MDGRDVSVHVGPNLPQRVAGAVRHDVPLVIFDAAAIFVAYFVPLTFAIENDVSAEYWNSFWPFLPIVLLVHLLANYLFGLYGQMWRFASVQEARRVVLASAAAFPIVFVANILLGSGTSFVLPRSVVVLGAVLSLVGIGAIRFQSRLFGFRRRQFEDESRRVLVAGAGEAGAMVLQDMQRNPQLGLDPVAIVDDDPRKIGRELRAVRIRGPISAIPALVSRLDVDEVLLAIPSASSGLVQEVAALCEQADVAIRVLPSRAEVFDGVVTARDIRDLRIEDLLGRSQVATDLDEVGSMLRGRTVLVTGAGGSIGSEIARQVRAFDPACLLVLDHDETHLHDLLLDVGDACVVPVLCDVRDRDRVLDVFERHAPDVVFHAAAHKHVPLMEENPCEAIKNNVRGTRLLAQASEFFGVDRFIFISTDKAVNPTSVMGASKRLAELAIQTQALGSGTSFAVVRFGNVLGSNGSVVPRFLDQIRKGGPVTITHPEMRRFFMLIPEAVQLVMHAASQAESGGIYVLEMGEQVRLVDMAKDLIRLAGFVPEEEIPIEFIGLRPGEKLYEELVGVNEVAGPSAIDKIHRVTSRRRPDPEFFTQLETIENQAAEGDVPGVRASLKRLIPEYTNPAEVVVTQVAQVDTEPIEADAEEEAEMSQVEGDVLYQYCPSCISARVHRSRARTIVERVRRNMTAERLFRCEQCGWRGWLMPLVRIESEPVDHTVQPDLSALDGNTAAPSVAAARRRFSPRDLQ
jgi:FlaA1/EpsC-like NDP-sugar epimerase